MEVNWSSRLRTRRNISMQVVGSCFCLSSRMLGGAFAQQLDKAVIQDAIHAGIFRYIWTIKDKSSSITYIWHMICETMILQSTAQLQMPRLWNCRQWKRSCSVDAGEGCCQPIEESCKKGASGKLQHFWMLMSDGELVWFNMNLVHPKCDDDQFANLWNKTDNSANSQALPKQAEMQEQRLAPGVDTFRRLVEMCCRGVHRVGGVTQWRW